MEALELRRAKHIGRPFREINWRKVDDMSEGVIVVGGFDFTGDEHPLQHAARGKGAKSGERGLKV